MTCAKEHERTESTAVLGIVTTAGCAHYGTEGPLWGRPWMGIRSDWAGTLWKGPGRNPK